MPRRRTAARTDRDGRRRRNAARGPGRVDLQRGPRRHRHRRPRARADQEVSRRGPDRASRDRDRRSREYRPVASTRDRDPRAGRSDRALDAGEVALESMPLCVSLVTDRRSRRPAALPLLSRPPGPISTTRRPTSSPAVCAWPAYRASATSASRMAARGATMGELPRAREAADIWLSFRAADGHSGAEAA